MVRITTARLSPVVVVSLLVLVGVSMWLMVSCTRSPDPTPQAATASVPQSLSVVPFHLESRPKITRKRGHAHLPLGEFGKNTYRYDGKIRMDDKRLHLTSDQPPIVAVRCEGRYYVLTQGHFHLDEFAWFADDGSGELTQVDVATLPKDTPFVEYKDGHLNHLYRTWFLRKTLRLDSAEGLKLLGRYLAADPRALYLDNWRQSHQRRAFRMYLSELGGAKQPELFVPHLITMLRASQRSDDPQTLEFLSVSIIAMGGKQGRNDVESYIQSLDPRDERRESLEEYVKELDDELLR